MFDNLKKHREDARSAKIQARKEKAQALGKLGKLQEAKYGELGPMVQEILTQYNEITKLNARFRGTFSDPCKRGHWTTYDHVLAEWVLRTPDTNRDWPWYVLVALKSDEKGLPTHFKVHIYTAQDGTSSLEIPGLSQKSLVQALEQLTK